MNNKRIRSFKYQFLLKLEDVHTNAAKYSSDNDLCGNVKKNISLYTPVYCTISKEYRMFQDKILRRRTNFKLQFLVHW